jgi:hypothetical protein
MSRLNHNVFVQGYGLLEKGHTLSKADKSALKKSGAKVHYIEEPKKTTTKESD